ncbi:hypothetical protein ACIRBY_15620 [Streptomyces sp. NPDC096136]|uniref:hypothetical protein n=1 Tax=Streptomyces sp. NPDC096136 TaxID=3366076 RepID=UPI00381EAC10
MISTAVDSTSQSYALGRVLGSSLVFAVALVVLWRATRSWRAPSTPPGGDHSDTVRRAAKRRRLVVGATVLIAVVAVVQAVRGYDPEPRAAEALPRSSAERTSTPSTGGPQAAVPGSFADFRLMTGAAAEQTKTAWLAGGTLPEGTSAGFYDQNADDTADLILMIRTTEANPGLKAEKARMSIRQEFRNFIAGARAHDATTFDAGEYGGGLICGLVTQPARDRAVCAWSDADTFAVTTLLNPATLPDAATTTLAARSAAMN